MDDLYFAPPPPSFHELCASNNCRYSPALRSAPICWDREQDNSATGRCVAGPAASNSLSLDVLTASTAATFYTRWLRPRTVIMMPPPQSLRGSNGLTSIRIFGRILLPCLWYNFARYVISSSVGGNDYFLQISSKSVKYLFVLSERNADVDYKVARYSQTDDRKHRKLLLLI